MNSELNDIFLQRLANRLAQRRRILKLTQAEVAERAGLDVETISRFERGKCVPSIATCGQLACILHTTVGKLVDAHEAIEQTAIQEILHDLIYLNENELTFVKNILGTIINQLLLQRKNNIVTDIDKTRQDKTRQDKTRQDKTIVS